MDVIATTLGLVWVGIIALAIRVCPIGVLFGLTPSCPKLPAPKDVNVCNAYIACNCCKGFQWCILFMFGNPIKPPCKLEHMLTTLLNILLKVMLWKWLGTYNVMKLLGMALKLGLDWGIVLEKLEELQ